jgi:hypothetical protein
VSKWISDEMREFFKENFGDPFSAPTKVKANPRDLTNDDRLDWDTALSKQPRIRQRTLDDVKRLMRNRNPIRFAQLQRDYRWLEKQMKKAGLNPEDARYLL